MPRLIDLILSDRGRILPAAWNVPYLTTEEIAAIEKHWKETIRSAAPFIFEASNVNEYFYKGTDQEFWLPDRDFPCMAPPSYVSWFEYGRPSGVWSTDQKYEDRFSLEHLPKKTGVLVMALDANVPQHRPILEGINEEKQGEESWWQQQKRPVRDLSQARMLLRMTVFMQVAS